MLANYVHVSFRKLRQRSSPLPFISGISSGTTTSVELLLLVLHDLSSINTRAKWIQQSQKWDVGVWKIPNKVKSPLTPWSELNNVENFCSPLTRHHKHSVSRVKLLVVVFFEPSSLQMMGRRQVHFLFNHIILCLSKIARRRAIAAGEQVPDFTYKFILKK